MKESDVIKKALDNNLDLQGMNAHGGTIYLGVAANTGLDLTRFYVRESTTITVLSGRDGTGATVNLLTLFAISGITLLAGDLFIAPSGYRITAATLTLGSILGYK